ncbi:MAG: hypothetical protein D5S01_01980 [Halanaerobium sp. MSAO_Bac5]|nr:MAG: hypothetical protein D5S01_01980 [Halanaerobium sp. MSAO_Bac5]
MNRVQLKHSK